MKSKKIFLIILIFIPTAIYAQQVVQEKEYYDWYNKKIKRIYHVLGDGTKHGTENFYFENGKLKISQKWTNGIYTSRKMFFSDGLPQMVINRNKEGEYNGEQLFYEYVHGKHYLKSKAKIESGFIKEFITYYNNGDLRWAYSNDGSIVEYKEFENKRLVTSLKFNNGYVSGFMDTDNATFEENRIVKLDDFEVLDNKLHFHNNYYDYYKTKIYENKCYIKAEFSEGILFELMELRLTLVNSNGHEITTNRAYSYYEEIQKEKITDFFLRQYVVDGKYIEKNNNIIQKEQFYDKGVLLYRNDFNKEGKLDQHWSYQNGERVCFKRFKDGIMQYMDTTLTNFEINNKTYQNISLQKFFNLNGKLEKEEIKDETNNTILKFKVYNLNGIIIDSDDLRTELDQLILNINKVSKEHIDLTDEIVNQMFNKFCLLNNGELITKSSQCFNKKIKNIYYAMQVLYKEFINSYLILDTIIKENLNKINNYNYNTKLSIIEKISIYTLIFNDYIKSIDLISNFGSNILIFENSITSPLISKNLNKQLKNKTDIIEIRSIFGIK